MFLNVLESFLKNDMLILDELKLMQTDSNCLEAVCTYWMKYYTYKLNQKENTEIDNFFYQEHFNEVKWYDV